MNKASRWILILACLVSPARAEDAPKKNWNDEAALSFSNTTGNSRGSTLAVDNIFNYDWSRTSLELKAGMLAEREKGRVTEEQYNAGQKVTRKVAQNLYGYELFRWDRDRFSGIRNRQGFSVGVGDELWRTLKDTLIAEAGAGYVSEERPDKNDHFPSGRLYGKYRRTLSGAARFSQDVECLESLEDARNYRINTETAVIADVSGHVALKASYKWKRIGKPAPGLAKDDTTTGVTLIVSY